MKNIILLLILFPATLNAQTDTLIRNGDGLIHFKTFGEGEPLLIINGGPGMNCQGFEGIAKMLSKHNRTIIYDQRGTGQSTLKKIDSSTITMNLMIGDIEALRKNLKIEKWIVLGHSFGGMLASWYATKFPDRIQALILSSSGGIDLELLSNVNGITSKLSKTELDSLNYWDRRISEGDTTYYARLQRGRALAPAYVYNRKYIPVIAERLTQGNSVINNLVWNDLRKIHFDCSNKLRSFSQPVLIIQGKDDIIQEKIAVKEHQLFKNSTVVLLEHSRHYGWLDNEGGYLDAIQHFLAAAR